ncbi:MAG: hypothetical protein WCC84_15270 [Candidatus Cybelea sp.]
MKLMAAKIFFGRTLVVVAAASALAACSSSGVGEPANGLQISGPYDNTRTGLTSSMWLSGGSYTYQGSKVVYFGIVDAYRANRKFNKRGVLWGPGSQPLVSPQGMVTDAQRNLYVVDGGASGAGRTYMYSPGTETPSKTFNDPGMFPVQVAVGSDGTLYVANIYSASFGPGNVVAYAPGSSNPTSTYTDVNFDQVVGIAVDRRKDIFVSYNTSPSSHGTVAVFRHGSSTATETGIQVPYNGSSSEAGVLALDVKDHLLLGYGADYGGVAVYASKAPYTQLGKFALYGHSQGLAFDRSGKTLYSADYSYSQGEIYGYDPGTFSVTQIGTVYPWFPNEPSYLGDARGIAVAPSLPIPK